MRDGWLSRLDHRPTTVELGDLLGVGNDGLGFARQQLSHEVGYSYAALRGALFERCCRSVIKLYVSLRRHNVES